MQPPAHAAFSLVDFATLKMEAIRSFETSVHTRSTRHYIPEDGILHSHRCETLKSYIDKVAFQLPGNYELYFTYTNRNLIISSTVIVQKFHCHISSKLVLEPDMLTEGHCFPSILVSCNLYKCMHN
jgi:hypothetical protein